MSFVKCTVCLEALHLSHNNQSAIPCGHVYHDPCIRNWIVREQNGSCPQCRQSVNENGILRLHFSTSDRGSLLSDIREELRVTQERLKETESSCAVVLEQSVSEQSRLQEQLHQAQLHARRQCQSARPSFGGPQQQQQYQVHALQEQLRAAQNQVQVAENICSTVIDQSNEQISKFRQCLWETQTNASTILEQCIEQQRELQTMLQQAKNEAFVIEEHSVVEQSKLQDSLQKLQYFAASVEDQAIVEQSRLQERLRETLVRASTVVEQSITEQSRLEKLAQKKSRRTSR